MALDDDQSYLDDIGKAPEAPATKPEAEANRTNKVNICLNSYMDENLVIVS